MTAEVTIINAQGIALAADSAVTVGRERVWKHANKIFSAGPRNDIGLMIFNAGDFLGIPWEVIVKEYRRRNAGRVFAKTSDFAQSFLAFLKTDLVSDAGQEMVSLSMVIIDIVESLRSALPYLSRAEFHTQLPAILDAEIADLQQVPELSGDLEKAKFRKLFKGMVRSAAKDAFKYTPKPEAMEKLLDLVWEHLRRESESEFSTGLVIAGFGRDELLPSMYTFVVDGKGAGLTRTWETKGRSLNLNEERFAGGAIFPFAQSDMAFLFMEGIYPKFIEFLGHALDKVLGAKAATLIGDYITDEDERVVERARQQKDNVVIVSNLLKEFGTYRRKEFVDRLMNTVGALPKEEMAFMAKAMVELTALRRKFTSTIESVGGAVDVALISKSDGFIWLSRKHYFDLDLNSDFLDRKTIVGEPGHETAHERTGKKEPARQGVKRRGRPASSRPGHVA